MGVNRRRTRPLYANGGKGVMLAGLVLLAGCGGLIAAEGATAVASGKTLSDHVVSFISGKDCSVVRTEQGKHYCVEDEPVLNQARLYCYRTLGDVICYDSADPRATSDTRIGLNEHNVAQ